MDEHQWMALHLGAKIIVWGLYSGFIVVDYALDRCQCNSVSFTATLLISHDKIGNCALLNSIHIIYVSP
jgi:hypothetical protein